MALSGGDSNLLSDADRLGQDNLPYSLLVLLPETHPPAPSRLGPPRRLAPSRRASCWSAASPWQWGSPLGESGGVVRRLAASIQRTGSQWSQHCARGSLMRSRSLSFKSANPFTLKHQLVAVAVGNRPDRRRMCLSPCPPSLARDTNTCSTAAEHPRGIPGQGWSSALEIARAALRFLLLKRLGQALHNSFCCRCAYDGVERMVPISEMRSPLFILLHPLQSPAAPQPVGERAWPREHPAASLIAWVKLLEAFGQQRMSIAYRSDCATGISLQGLLHP